MSSIFKYKAGSHIDLVGSRTLTPTGVTYKQGDRGTYGVFGGGAYLTASSSILPSSGPFSVVAFAKVGRNVTLGTDRSVLIGDTTAGSTGVKLSENDGVNGKPILSLADVNFRYFNYTNDKKWHCFIFTIPGSANADIASSAMYVDTVAQANFATLQTVGQTRTHSYIGGGNTAGKGADIAYLEVLNHVVSQQEIDAYQAMFESLKQTAKAKRNFVEPSGAVDIDGNQYTTIQIGEQTWMVENLKTTRYNDGTAIPNVTDTSAWAALSTGAYCDYSNTPANSDVYGRLYNWFAVNTGKLAPKGWHIPTDAEWTTLTDYLGGLTVAGGKLKEAGLAYWTTPNTGANNMSKFTALPGGRRLSNGSFGNIGSTAYFWSSSVYSSANAWFWSLNYNNDDVGRNDAIKLNGFSVRCIKDTSKTPRLREDFSDTPVSGFPIGWLRGSGTYAIDELTADVQSGSLRLPRGYRFLKCSINGTIALPCEFARGKRFEFDVFKGADGNNLYINFINNVSNRITFQGYYLAIAFDETVRLIQANTPTYNTILNTVTSYITINTWYRVRIDVTATTFTVYLKGGALTATAGCDGWHKVVASSGANPATDSTYSTSKFFTLDLDALDRIGNIVISEL